MAFALLNVCLLFGILLLGLQFLVPAGHIWCYTCGEKPIKDTIWTAVLWRTHKETWEIDLQEESTGCELKIGLINSFWVTRTRLLTHKFPWRKVHCRWKNFVCTWQIERGHCNCCNCIWLAVTQEGSIHFIFKEEDPKIHRTNDVKDFLIKRKGIQNIGAYHHGNCCYDRYWQNKLWILEWILWL